jgi:hypothetical protein
MSRTHIATTRTYKFVGKCVYCGVTEGLHDEHVIPESLNGVRLLEKGSCRKCGDITSKFEGAYARESMLAARTALNMKSKRSKKKRPTEFPMRLGKGDKEETVNVPISDHCSLIPMVEIGPPSAVPTLPHAQGLKARECVINTYSIRTDEQIEEISKKYNADRISVDYIINIAGFLRIIAKIAYCTVIWRYGLSNIAKAYVVPSILGETEDITHWVGSDGRQDIYYEYQNENTDHIITTRQLEDGTLCARVKLFKKSFTPEYEVIVGRMKEGTHGLFQGLGYR